MQKSSWVSHGSTSLFVLLWSSGAITAKLSLLYAIPFAFLLMRLGLAFAVLCLLAARPLPAGPGQPAPDHRDRLAWLGLVISVGATLLFYHLIQGGDLVNMTSLFYLVPAGTALLDYLLLGNPLPPLALAGMAAILGGLALVMGRRRARCARD